MQKDLEPKIIFKMIITNYNGSLINSIENKLKEIISKYSKSKLTLIYDHHEQYWKFPEETVSYFSIYCEEKIKVLDLIKLFENKDWFYRESEVCNAENIKQTKLDQNAVWSQTISNEVFLDKNVTWVNIYNWGWDN